MAQNNQNSSKAAYRELSEKSRELLGDIYSEICNYRSSELPDLRDIFQPAAIDYLLGIKSDGSLVDSLIKIGYKDVPEVDENGKPILRRSTPIHRVSEWDEDGFVTSRLFRIYDRFDVNYSDDCGVTHFHLACYQNCADEVKKFLEAGQDPNCFTTDGDSPLHYALRYPEHESIELLLRGGANPNLANKGGSTPLHYICEEGEDEDLAKMIFELSNEKYRPVQVNAWDKWGNAPLHYAQKCPHDEMIELLLKNGADPNLANEKGLTPLHIICKDGTDVNYLLEMFFKINKELDQQVQVDARDELGRTPLQYAVARLLPEAVDMLLDHGANQSSFVFPTESHFVEMSMTPNDLINFKLRIATGLLAVVESLGKRGYELDRSEALMIIKFFVKHGFIQYSSDIRKHWYGYHKFTSEAKKLMIQPNLSIYDLMMRPEEASKRLAYSDYYRFALQDDFKYISKDLKEAYSVYIGEKISRGFFRRWTMEYLLGLTSQFKLPSLCCETIAKQLINRDLWHVYLAATGQNS